KTAQALSPFQEGMGVGAVEAGPIERSLHHLFIRKRNLEARAEPPQLSFIEFFLLVSNVPSLARLSQTVTFDCLGQYDCRLPPMFYGRLVSGIDLSRIVASPE